MARLFGTDGVRGTYGQDLTDDLARALGRAAALVLGSVSNEPKILIGRDTRASGPALELALAEGFASAGGTALSAGVFPTAGIAHLVRTTGCVAGAVISASHNPAKDNGIKFFGPDGLKLPDLVEDEIESRLEKVKPFEFQLEELENAEDNYVEFLLDGTPNLSGLRVVVDCANGAASNIAPEVYRLAGATEVVVLAADPDGTNINDHCGSTHPERLQELVVAHGAHIGIAHDGDADRCLAVDEHGRIVDGDQILAICATEARARGVLDNDGVVTTVMANLGFRNAMKRDGINVIETQVGDRYVLAAMLEHGIVMGGEQSGHIVFLDRHTTGDGILTALKLLSVIARTGHGLSDLAARFPRFPQIMVNVPVRDRNALPAAAAVWDEIKAAEDVMSGDGRVLVRASGTEQLVRVMAEAPTEDAARAAVDRIVKVVARELG